MILSDLGGILEIIVLGVPLIIISYRKYKFDSELIRELYQVDNEKPVQKKRVNTIL